jgi:SSS family solute:Na+ symporter
MMGVTGLTEDIHLKIIMTVLLGMVLLYTTLGGMVSEVVLDYIQFGVLSIALLAASFLCIKHLGWQNIIQTVSDLKGEAGFNPFHGEGFGTSYVIWMFVLGLVNCAIWQTAVMRACAADSTRTVKRIYTFASVGFLIRFLIPYFLGISAFVYLAHNDKLKDIFVPENGPADPQATLMALPVFLSQILPAGFIGIVTAGMLAAFMSTHDSYLLCWSSVLTQDVVAPWFKKELSSKVRVLLIRVFIVLIGIYILVWGLWYDVGQDLWDYMAISGAIYFTGAIPLLVFGLYWRRASKVGAYLALICGFFAVLGLKPVRDSVLGLIGSFGTHASHVRAYVDAIPSARWSAFVGLSVIAMATILMVMGSLLFPDRRSSIQSAP